jgi:hypothetical protein
MEGLPRPGEFLITREVWLTCPKCATTVRPWIEGSTAKCGHCGFEGEMTPALKKRLNP